MSLKERTSVSQGLFILGMCIVMALSVVIVCNDPSVPKEDKFPALIVGGIMFLTCLLLPE